MRELLDPTVGSIVVLCIVGLTAWALRSSHRSRGRQAGGLCVRCGRERGTVEFSNAFEPLRMCEACATMTLRNYRTGYRFFLGCGGAFGAWILALVTLDFWLSPAVRGLTECRKWSSKL